MLQKLDGHLEHRLVSAARCSTSTGASACLWPRGLRHVCQRCAAWRRRRRRCRRARRVRQDGRQRLGRREGCRSRYVYRLSPSRVQVGASRGWGTARDADARFGAGSLERPQAGAPRLYLRPLARPRAGGGIRGTGREAAWTRRLGRAGRWRAGDSARPLRHSDERALDLRDDGRLHGVGTARVGAEGRRPACAEARV